MENLQYDLAIWDAAIEISCGIVNHFDDNGSCSNEDVDKIKTCILNQYQNEGFLFNEFQLVQIMMEFGNLLTGFNFAITPNFGVVKLPMKVEKVCINTMEFQGKTLAFSIIK